MNRRIRFEYTTCGRGILNPQKKSYGFKNVRISVVGAEKEKGNSNEGNKKKLLMQTEKTE